MSRKRLLLIGWDSADWKIIRPLAAEGKLPVCSRLMAEGVSGNLTTLEPQLSPMLWTAIATGKHAYHHGVPGFTEVNEAGQVVPVSAATRQCKALWEMLGERGLKSHVVSWFATQGEQMPAGGCLVSHHYNSFPHKASDATEDWPAPMAGTYFPADLAERLNDLRVSPWDMDGNEVLRLFVPNADQIDQKKDPRLWHLAQRLAEAFSVHAASCWLLEHRPDWDFMGIYYRAIDEICHEFMLYHPPQMAGTKDEDYAMYQEVVAGAYRIHDHMLARLLQLAGPETAVVLVSDHGFHSDHLRPKFTPRVPAGITVWHRPQGIIAAMGPGFKHGEAIYGARLLDVAPTVLTYFGLPVGADMEGRVLVEAFTEKPAVQTIPSWEDTGRTHTAPAVPLSDADNKALLDQFVALGYINEISADPTQAAAETTRENAWNMARACMDTGRYEQALPLLEEIYHGMPERTDWAQTLARCQMRLGLLDEAQLTAAATLATFNEAQAAAAHTIQANIAIERKQAALALEHLAIAGEKQPRDLQFLSLSIEALLKLHRWEECQTVCRTTLEVDPQNALAHIGLARCALHQGEPEVAANHALEAIGYQYGNPRGHFLLGVALHELAQYDAAVQALHIATELAPRFYVPWRYKISALHRKGDKDAAEHARLTLLFLRHQHRTEDRAATERVRAASEARVPGIIADREKRRATAAALVAAREASALPADQEFVLVSGLPRSGTSLMMQILRAGGMDLMHDDQRQADEDNLEGYWEWEDIKKMPQQPLIIEQAHGKVTKVVSLLLGSLPPKHRYKILFMRRPVTEVVASQWKMLDHRGKAAKTERDHLEATQQKHVEQLLAILRGSGRVDLLEVDYPALVTDPLSQLPRIQDFLGTMLVGSLETLAAVVKPELYRNRSEGA